MTSEHAGVGSPHPHGHAHTATSRNRLVAACAITSTILVAQLVGTMVTGSLALLVDSAHMLTDAAGLFIAATAAHLVMRPPTERRTWGLARLEVLAAGAQAAVLLAVGVYAVVEGVRRLFAPEPVASGPLLAFGLIGLLGNIAALLVLGSARDANLNMRAAFLEVVNDALGSIAVIVGAIVIATTGWTRADAVAGLLIAALIMPRAVAILREAGNVLLESAPPGLDLADVRAHILALDHVIEVHDLHASRIGTRLPVLSAHVVLEDSCFADGHTPRMLIGLQECLASHFEVSVTHSTFQFEPVGHAAQEQHRHA